MLPSIGVASILSGLIISPHMGSFAFESLEIILGIVVVVIVMSIVVTAILSIASGERARDLEGEEGEIISSKIESKVEDGVGGRGGTDTAARCSALLDGGMYAKGCDAEGCIVAWLDAAMNALGLKSIGAWKADELEDWIMDVDKDG